MQERKRFRRWSRHGFGCEEKEESRMTPKFDLNNHKMESSFTEMFPLVGVGVQRIEEKNQIEMIIYCQNISYVIIKMTN